MNKTAGKKKKKSLVDRDLGNEIYDSHIMVHLALSGEDIQRLQFCCEFVEQFISQADERHRELWKDFGLTHGNVYWFGDEWSFKLRHIMEDEYRKRKEI